METSGQTLRKAAVKGGAFPQEVMASLVFVKNLARKTCEFAVDARADCVKARIFLLSREF
jgi:hypothetical protein